MVDYFSRFIEILILLASQKSSETIRAVKSIFATHRIPEILRSDNGPQFISTEFDEFSKEYLFTHVTSSQKLPKANGEAERAAQTTKNALKKEKDLAKALMSYGATSLENGYSPAEMLLARKIRTTVPVLPDQLKPSWPGLQEVREHKQESKYVQTKRYNVSHRWTELSALKPVGGWWITLVLCGTQDSFPIRRNRRHLEHVPATDSPTGASPERGHNAIISTVIAVGIPRWQNTNR